MADLFLDTFTGTGTLATHVPDLGGAWVDADRPLTQFTLNGDGTCQRATFAGDNGAVAIPVVDPGGAVGYEATVVIKRVQLGETNGYLEFESFDTQFYAALYTASGVDMTLEIGAPSGEFVDVDIEAPVLGAVYTVRLELDATRTQLKCYLNDVLTLSMTEPEPAPLVGNMWVTMGSRGASLPLSAYDSVRMFNAVPDPEPEPEPIDCCPPLPQRTDPGCGTTSCGREFSEKTVSWSDTVKVDGEYTFPETRLNPVETVLVTAPVGRNNEDYRLTVGSVLWAPLTIAAIEWTGQYFNNARRT